MSTTVEKYVQQEDPWTDELNNRFNFSPDSTLDPGASYKPLQLPKDDSL